MSHVLLCIFQLKTIATGGDLLNSTRPLDFLPGFNLEGLPNRDSTKYQKVYGIEGAHTVLRGTIRSAHYEFLC